jgi:tRNA 2-thiouridine synthesizing protein A
VKKIEVRKKNIKILDTTGLQCSQAVLKIAAKSADMKLGDLIEVVADCPTFEKDVRYWCKRVHRTLLWIRIEEDKKRCQIQF